VSKMALMLNTHTAEPQIEFGSVVNVAYTRSVSCSVSP
jgi:hypothetical protein